MDKTFERCQRIRETFALGKQGGPIAEVLRDSFRFDASLGQCPRGKRSHQRCSSGPFVNRMHKATLRPTLGQLHVGT